MDLRRALMTGTSRRMKTAFAALFLSVLMPVLAADVPGLKTLAIGDAAPAFSLVGIDEETHKLEEYAKAPLLMVAIDLKHQDAALCEALRANVRRIVSTFPHARLACVTVMRTARIGLDSNLDAEGRNRHVKRLIALRDWVRPLVLDADRVNVHVLGHSDPVHALLDYARDNRVDHLVMGARGITGVRRLLGSVSARVVAEAPCTVTVVRAAGPHASDLQ